MKLLIQRPVYTQNYEGPTTKVESYEYRVHELKEGAKLVLGPDERVIEVTP